MRNNGTGAPRWLAVSCIALSAVLSGCGGGRDPATEAEVEILPGMFQLQGQIRPVAVLPNRTRTAADDDDRVCLRDADARRAVATTMRRLWQMPACVIGEMERTGNAISGTMRCPLDAERMPGGAFVIHFSGSVAAEEISLTQRMEMQLPAAPQGMSPEQVAQTRQGLEAMNDREFGFALTRVGDCGASR